MNQKGQSLVEVALMLPILLLLFVSLVEAGFCIYTAIEHSAQTREFARYAGRGYDFYGETTSPDESSVFARASQVLPEGYSMRLTYVTIEDNEATEIITDSVGDEPFTSDPTEQLLEDRAAVIGVLGKVASSKATWAIVDTAQPYQPIFWPDIWPVRKLKARAVFRVTLHIRREPKLP